MECRREWRWGEDAPTVSLGDEREGFAAEEKGYPEQMGRFHQPSTGFGLVVAAHEIRAH